MNAFSSLLHGVLPKRTSEPSIGNATASSSMVARASVLGITSEASGIPALTIDDVLSTQQELIDRINVCYGMGQPAFAQELLPLIQRYAGFVHLLPATPDRYFTMPGGLLRLGLEVAFFSLQGTDGQIFSGRSTVTARRHLDSRWRQATFIAGLCCAIDRPFWLMRVTDEHGNEWEPYLLPLSTWLVRRQIERYGLKWRPNAEEAGALSLFALRYIIPDSVMQHLAAGNTVIVPQMIGSITGVPLCRERSILDELVHRSMTLVIDRDLQDRVDGHSTSGSESRFVTYFVDALRWLVTTNPIWRPNVERSRVWFGSDGVFLVWPNAASEMRQVWESQQLSEMPTTPDAILKILVARSLIQQQDQACATWEIFPPEAQAAIQAIKLSSPQILFADLDPAPIPLPIALSHQRATNARPAAGAAARHSHPAASSQRSPPVELHTEALPADRPSTTQAQNDMGAAPVRPPSTGCPVQFLLALESGKLKLDAPMRLDPAVYNALAQIIDSLNQGDSRVAVCIVPSGVFIPMAEFERRNIEPSLAIRALADAKMLIQPADTCLATTRCEVGGGRKVGLILDPRFVAGLDPADFASPKASGAPC